METMIKNTKRTLIFISAIFLVVIGIAGLILPLIPGLIFIALALVIFSIFFPEVGEKLHHYTRNYPRLQEAIKKMEDFVRRITGEL